MSLPSISRKTSIKIRRIPSCLQDMLLLLLLLQRRRLSDVQWYPLDGSVCFGRHLCRGADVFLRRLARGKSSKFVFASRARYRLKLGPLFYDLRLIYYWHAIANLCYHTCTVVQQLLVPNYCPTVTDLQLTQSFQVSRFFGRSPEFW